MENVTVGFTVLGILLGSLVLLAAILRSGKIKHDQSQNKQSSNINMC